MGEGRVDTHTLNNELHMKLKIVLTLLSLLFCLNNILGKSFLFREKNIGEKFIDSWKYIYPCALDKSGGIGGIVKPSPDLTKIVAAEAREHHYVE